MTVLDFDPELEALKEKSIDRLLTADVFDRAAFEGLLAHLDNKAALLRDQHLVPKQVLQCLRGASEAITSRAEYMPDVRASRTLADTFALLLDFILRGETLRDRAPGVPRVV